MAEITTSIVVVCLPALRPLIRRTPSSTIMSRSTRAAPIGHSHKTNGIGSAISKGDRPLRSISPDEEVASSTDMTTVGRGFNKDQTDIGSQHELQAFPFDH
jgi:hypothetical protein